MSYEYRLVFDDSYLMQCVIGSLKSSEACIKVEGREIYLKDQLLQSVAQYDVKLTLEGNLSVWLEVNFRSMGLYDLFQKALGGGGVKCYEDGDVNDEVSLKEVFRIKGGRQI
ncbi:hypothetical protein ACCC97_11830 [Variovorax sp. Varisp85]|uniref:hypothetical protein n=1 Tax=Variovorax sp. Varisp85 TaxID=3243059 RepID=UPI0039A78266